jgi:hypothetical protein
VTATALEYEVKQPNENHEEIVVRFDLTVSSKMPNVEIEVPAYKEDGVILSPRQSIRMTLGEFNMLSLEVENFRKMMAVANVQ